MINLLPPDIKLERKYARHNRKLVMWLGVSLLGIATLFAVSGGAYVLLQQAIATQESNNESLNNTLKAQQVDTKIAEFKNFSDDLSTVTGILDQQYIFSNLVQRIGGTLPPDSVLSGIALTGEDRTLTLTFNAKDNAVANQILVNLNDKQNGLFEQADTLSISCQPIDPEAPTAFACTTSLKVLFFEDSDFVLLNGLLTEQALADALNNMYEQDGLIVDAATEQVRIDGLKNTFNISVLTDSAQQGNTVMQQLRSSTFEYQTVNENGDSSIATTEYMTEVNQTSQACSLSIQNPINAGKLYSCRTIATITFNTNPSQEELEEEKKEQNGIDSLLEDFTDAFGTKSGGRQ